MAAGVSQAAVSLVLNKAETPSVPPATRERILRSRSDWLSAEPSGPDPAQRADHDVCLRHSDITNPFYPGLVRRTADGRGAAGLCVLIFDTDGRPDGEGARIDWLLQGRADGVVATSFICARRNSRCVAPQRASAGAARPPGGGSGPPIDSVYHRQCRGGRRDDPVLIQRGHRRIAMIHGRVRPDPHPCEGYERGDARSRVAISLPQRRSRNGRARDERPC